ncbi:FAD-binding protein [Paenarthrobacter sp. NPDC089316]|uniref:FAD-binding protein n=1 Tax=unclassified Paenarthrobacter TaxID=2634190 RepID=UPI0034353A97
MNGTNTATDTIYDLLVVGTGAAGLTTATEFLHAADKGGWKPSIAVIDKAPVEESGGATRWSWVNLFVNQHGQVDPEVINRVIGGHPDVDDQYFRTLEAESGDTAQWMRTQGVQIAYQNPGIAMESDYGAVVGGGQALLDALMAQLRTRKGVEFLYSTEALMIHQNGAGEVDGLTARTADGTEFTLRARTVVVACGGFEGSPEKLKQYVGDRGADIKPVVPGLRYNVGDGLRMITQVGGATSGQFEKLHVQLVDSRASKPDAGIFGVPYGIIVNNKGQRFIDEGSRTFEGLNAPLAWSVWRDHENEAYVIFDAQTDAIPAFSFLNQTNLEPVSATTIPGLAEALGLDPVALHRTIEEFNAATVAGPFDPATKDGLRTQGLGIEKTNWARPLTTGPFIAYPVRTAGIFSFGGVRTDIDGRVIGTGGQPIPGLYAAGVTTGVWYTEYPGAMSILRAVTFGRRAGRHAAYLAATRTNAARTRTSPSTAAQSLPA